MRVSTEFTHAEGCKVEHLPPIELFGTYGDRLMGCPSCRAKARIDPPAVDPTEPPGDGRPVPPRRGWRCGEHGNRPVDWRARGCPECRRDRIQREAERAAERAERARRLAERTAELAAIREGREIPHTPRPRPRTTRRPRTDPLQNLLTIMEGLRA